MQAPRYIPVPLQRIKCEISNRLYAIVSEEGISLWCVNCRKAHMMPREEAIARLQGTWQGDEKSTCQGCRS